MCVGGANGGFPLTWLILHLPLCRFSHSEMFVFDGLHVKSLAMAAWLGGLAL